MRNIFSSGNIGPTRDDIRLVDVARPVLNTVLYKIAGSFLRNTAGYRRWSIYRGKKPFEQAVIYADLRAEIISARARKLFLGIRQPTRFQRWRLKLGTASLNRAFHKVKNASPQNQTAFANLPQGVQVAASMLASLSRHQHQLQCIELTDAPVCSVYLPDKNLGATVSIVATGQNSSTGVAADYSSAKQYNRKAESTKAEYLLLVDQELQISKDQISELFLALMTKTNAGIACAAVVDEWGLVKEAGRKLLPDGTSVECGQYASLDWPEFAYTHEAECSSPQCLMISKTLFDCCGGFLDCDSDFAHAVTDLSLRIRNAGKLILVAPSVVVCKKTYETPQESARCDAPDDLKQTESAPQPSGDFQIHTSPSRSALVIDASTPTPDRDSGSIDTLNTLKALQEIGYHVTFIPDDLLQRNGYTSLLKKEGIRCFNTPYIQSIKEHLTANGKLYDLVVVKRVGVAAKNIDDIRTHCPRAKVVFDTVDLHFLREERQALVENAPQLRQKAVATKRLEYGTMRRADATIFISETETALVTAELPDIRAASIPYARDTPGRSTPFASRTDIVFIGSFFHAPNVDAVIHFVTTIWPLVHQELPEARFRIVGSNMPGDIYSLSSYPGVVAQGFVPNIKDVLDHCKLTVAPLRYGAGIKGKIGTSLSHGVPCVATPIAAEGLSLQENHNIMVSTDVAAFAETIVRVYRNEELWTRLSDNGVAFMRDGFSFEQYKNRIQQLIEQISRD